jgi:hypothetical protein
MSEKKYKVTSFPKTSSQMVVWWFGPVYHNSLEPTIPLVEVLMRVLDSGGGLSDKLQSYLVPLAELDIIRIGTIWQNQQMIGDFIEPHRQQFSFIKQKLSFDLSNSSLSTVPTFQRGAYYSVPREKYHLGNFLLNGHINSSHFYSSRLAKIEDSSKSVLIPTVVVLAGIIAFGHKQIRAGLVNYELGELREKYIRDAKIKKDGGYEVEFKNFKRRENCILLSYMSLNPIAQKRLSIINASCQKSFSSATSSEYSIKYLDALPYHPKKFEFVFDGVLLKNNQFLALRVLECNVPDEIKIDEVSIRYDTEQKGEKSGGTKPSDEDFSDENLDDDGDAIIEDHVAPHNRNSLDFIRSSVRIINKDKPIIEKVIKTKTREQSRYITNEEREPSNSTSSGESGERKESEGVGQLRQDEFPDENKKSFLSNIESILHELASEEFLSFKGVCGELKDEQSDTNLIHQISKSQLPEKYPGAWHKFQVIKKEGEDKNKTPIEVRYRKFLLAKITLLEDGSSAYLLEIQRKKKESYSGLLFNTQDGSLSQSSLDKLIRTIVLNGGRYKRKKGNGFKEVALPIAISDSYKHQKNDMNKALKYAIQSAQRRDIFY